VRVAELLHVGILRVISFTLDQSPICGRAVYYSWMYVLVEKVIWPHGRFCDERCEMGPERHQLV